ncbi:MAG: hypothetical protein GX815_13455 [Clostridiales bacterium]|nr:hypothetical protein [Clostridiales bacterium]
MKLNYSEYMDKVTLSKLGNSEEAGLWISSLPIPAKFPKELELSVNDNQQGVNTYIKELGNWAGKEAGNPRRLLLFADGNNSAPDKIGLVQAGEEINKDSGSTTSNYQTPTIDMELIEECQDPAFAWERHMVVISWGVKKIGLLMGLKTKDTVHWWEACKLITLEDHTNCKEVEIGGAIPLVKYDSTDSKSVGYENPLLHRHNWLNGNIYARLHSNGVCEIFAHHINSKFFDDGLDLKDAVPVIGFRFFDEHDVNNDILGTWTGDKELLNLGNIEFDISDARHLAKEKSSGSFEYHDDFLVWQPYEGAELYGGAASKAILGDEFIFRAEDKLIPRGMSRTVRFSFSLSDRSPKVVRYIAPAWWYGVCEEFLPEPLLPISNEYDKLIEGARSYIKEYTVKGGYEDGSVPRNIGTPGEGGRFEPGWEGEMPGGQFLCAYRTSDYEDYDLAMRSAYVFTDVYVDHAAKAVRMHGFPAYGFSVPMNRIHGPLYAYLETGDPYLLQTAKAVIDTSYYTHKNSWPRLAVGRDACFIRGAVLLYRYFNDLHYKEVAENTIKDVIASQREDGSFGDQGGGTGVHQWAAYIIKPWMGLMAMGGIVDYLELDPEEPEMLSSVKKFGDWLLRERFEHIIKPNAIRAKGWAYQHYFKDDVMFQLNKKWVNLKEPDGNLWHVEYLARFLGYCSITFNDPAYLDAWAESYEAYYGDKPEVKGDHAAVQIFQYIPWLQAKLWNAKLSEDGVSLKPFRFGPRTVKEASVMTPTGKLNVKLS